MFDPKLSETQGFANKKGNFIFIRFDALHSQKFRKKRVSCSTPNCMKHKVLPMKKVPLWRAAACKAATPAYFSWLCQISTVTNNSRRILKFRNIAAHRHPLIVACIPFLQVPVMGVSIYGVLIAIVSLLLELEDLVQFSVLCMMVQYIVLAPCLILLRTQNTKQHKDKGGKA